MPDQYTLQEFGQRIKAKYPQYKDLADEDIANKVLAKYPQYKSAIKTAQSDDLYIAPSGPEGNDAISRFASSAAAPFVGAAKGIYHAVTDAPQTPLETGLAYTGLLPIKRTLVDPSIEQLRESYGDAQQGRYSEAVGHSLAAAIPGLGPWAASFAETEGKQLGSGDYAGAAGSLAGNAALALVPKAMGKIPGVAGKVVRGAAGTGAKTVRDLIKETKEQNLKTEVANQKLGEQHLEQTQDALHESEGRELGYKQAVKSAVDAARDKQTELDQAHNQAVQDVLHENAGKELAYQQELSKAKLESEDAYQKKLAEVEAKRLKAKQDYRKDLLDYSKKKAKLQADYQDAVDKAASEAKKQAKIKPTEGRLKQAYSALRARVETARENALRIGNSKYSAVNQALSPLPADMEVVHGLYGAASDALGEAQAVPSLLNRLGKSLEQGEQLTYADEQALYSELGKELSKGTLPGNLYHAYDQMHEGIGADMQRMADSKGMGAQLTQARNYWRRMKQTFGKPYGATDAATKTVRDAAGNLVSADEQANRIRLLGSFDQRLPGLFEHVENLQRGSESLPKAKPGRATLASVIEARKASPSLPPKPVPIPDPEAVAPRAVPQPLRAEIPDRPGTVAPKMPVQPERVAPPDRPQYAPGKKIGPEDVRAAKQKGIEARQRQVEHKAAWLAIGPLFYMVNDLVRMEAPSIGGTALSVAAPLMVQSIITRVLSSPKAVEFLTKATPEDVAQIPPELRGNFPKILAQAQKRGIRVSPALIRAFTGAALAGTRKYDVQTGTDSGASPGSAQPSMKGTGVSQNKNEPLIKGKNPEDEPREESYARNRQWAKPGPYITKLSPQDEAEFQTWARKHPDLVQGEMDPKTADYDVRGRWLADKHGDPHAKLVRNPWDGKLHSSDKWKMPYDATFSRESIYALPSAPYWDEHDRLIRADGQVIVDEGYDKSKK